MGLGGFGPPPQALAFLEQRRDDGAEDVLAVARPLVDLPPRLHQCVEIHGHNLGDGVPTRRLEDAARIRRFLDGNDDHWMVPRIFPVVGWSSAVCASALPPRRLAALAPLPLPTVEQDTDPWVVEKLFAHPVEEVRVAPGDDDEEANVLVPGGSRRRARARPRSREHLELVRPANPPHLGGIIERRALTDETRASLGATPCADRFHRDSSDRPIRRAVTDGRGREAWGESAG